MAVATLLVGSYLGRKRVQEGRNDELSPGERKELARAKADSRLSLVGDGTFSCDITCGTWKSKGERLILTPTTFGGQTSEDMGRQAAEMGRAFSLAFLFRPFDLRVVGETLVTGTEDSLIFTEYRRIEV